MSQAVMERRVANAPSAAEKPPASAPKNGREPARPARHDTRPVVRVVGMRHDDAARDVTSRDHADRTDHSASPAVSMRDDAKATIDSARGSGEATADSARGNGKTDNARAMRESAVESGADKPHGDEPESAAKPVNEAGKADGSKENADAAPDTDEQRSRGVYASVKRAATSAVEQHGHAVLYGIVGFVAAALILIVGFWPTVLLALFAAIGAAIGMYRDGDRTTRERVSSVLKRFT